MNAAVSGTRPRTNAQTARVPGVLAELFPIANDSSQSHLAIFVEEEQ
jgi:hypothetical protein